MCGGQSVSGAETVKVAGRDPATGRTGCVSTDGSVIAEVVGALGRAARQRLGGPDNLRPAARRQHAGHPDGDQVFAPLLNPSLTTIRLPVREAAEHAMAMLLDSLNGKARMPEEEVRLCADLVIRESCGGQNSDLSD